MSTDQLTPEERYYRLGEHLLDAIESNDLPRVTGCISAGSDVNYRNCHGETPLHIAAQGGNLNIIILLIRLGVDVNCVNIYQDTPLHYAHQHNHIVQALLSVGAQQGINQEGNTYLNWANSLHSATVVSK